MTILTITNSVDTDYIPCSVEFYSGSVLFVQAYTVLSIKFELPCIMLKNMMKQKTR